MTSVRFMFRRGIPYPPVEIRALLAEHYLKEKEICKKIRELDRQDSNRSKLFLEVYQIAHEAMEKYVEAGFLSHETKSKLLFALTVNKLFSKTGRVLELGCGRGALLSKLKELGWACKGVEINERLVEDDIKKDVKFSDILLYEDKQLYDLIVLDQVLEHIPKNDCDYLLNKLYRLLKTGGFLVSRTPNSLNGPHDVSRWFLPLGSQAEGTHFNELTLSEIIFKLKKIGFRSFYTPLLPVHSRLPKPLHCFFSWTKFKIPASLVFEKIYPFIPYPLKPVYSFPVFIPMTVAAQK